jgi:hypothetical protein
VGFLITIIHCKGNQMTKFRMLTVIAILSAAIASPASAAGDEGSGTITPHATATHHHARAHHRSFRGAYNRDNSDFRRNKQNFGFSGRDRSRIGGESPSVNPAP